MSLSQAFIQEWTDEVTHLASQEESRMMPVVRTHRNVTGKTYNFHRMGNVSAYDRPDGSYDFVSALDAPTSVIPTILTNLEAPQYIPHFDQLKVNYDARAEYQREMVNAINRGIDDKVIAAMATATNTQTTAALNFAAVQAAAFYLDSSDVEIADRVLVIGSQQLQDLLATEQFTNQFYLGQIASMQGPVVKGQIAAALGFDTIVRTNRLPLSGTNRTCFAFAKYGVGLAVAKDLETTVDWVADRQSWLVVSKASVGAAVIDQARITKVVCSDS